MKKAKKLTWIGLLSLGWFLILPFPFERQVGPGYLLMEEVVTKWQWFGGYHLIETKFGFLLPIDHWGRQEINDSLYQYSHSWFLVILIIVSIILGWLTYLLIKKFKKVEKSKPKSKTSRS